MLKWLFRALRYRRDVKAVQRGRVGQRIWNRAVSKLLRRAGRKLYK